MGQVTVFCFLASYFVAFALELSRLLRRTKISRYVILLFTFAGLVAHTFYLFAQSKAANLPPLLSSTHDWLLVLTWIVILTYLFFAIFDRDLAIGMFVLPIVLLMILAGEFVSDATNSVMLIEMKQARELAIHRWAMLHAGLLVFAAAGVLGGFIISLMYLFQHRRLKQHQKIRNNLTLPNLASLERWNRWVVKGSILLLTLGMMAGIILGLYSRKQMLDVSFRDPVVVVSGIVWLVMVVFIIWLIRADKEAGKSVAWRTLWAFGFLLVTLLVLQIITGGGMAALDTWHTGIAVPENCIVFNSCPSFDDIS